MTITITANEKTITIEIPEAVGEDVKVSVPGPHVASPVVELPPQKSVSQKTLWRCPDNTGHTQWRYPQSRIVLFDSCDAQELMNTELGHCLKQHEWLVIPTDKSFKGSVYSAREIGEMLEGASRVTLTDADGHLLMTVRRPHEKTAEYDLKILTDYGAKKLAAGRFEPEAYYYVWRTKHTSVCPHIAENLLAA